MAHTCTQYISFVRWKGSPTAQDDFSCKTCNKQCVSHSFIIMVFRFFSLVLFTRRIRLDEVLHPGSRLSVTFIVCFAWQVFLQMGRALMCCIFNTHSDIPVQYVCLFYLVRYLVMMRYDIGFTPRYLRCAPQPRTPTGTDVFNFEDVHVHGSHA